MDAEVARAVHDANALRRSPPCFTPCAPPLLRSARSPSRPARCSRAAVQPLFRLCSAPFWPAQATVQPPPATMRRHFNPPELHRTLAALGHLNRPRNGLNQPRTESAEMGIAEGFWPVLATFPSPDARPALRKVDPRVEPVVLRPG